MLKLMHMRDKIAWPKINYFKDAAAVFTSIADRRAGPRVVLSSPKLSRLLGLGSLTAGTDGLRCVLTSAEGERCKSLAEAEKVIKKLLKLGAGRRDRITVFGGGSLTDLGAFCASIFKRGCGLTLVPTTLLAMIDAAVGGKTAVNAGGVKNCAGTFYQAGEIIVCPDFLTTLPQREIENGLFEAVKYAALFSEGMLKDIVSNQPAMKRYSRRSAPLFRALIRKCVAFKTKAVKKDPFDRRERLALNFGHTFGHAIESVSGGKIPHGAAVGLGMLYELALAEFIYGPDAGNAVAFSMILRFARSSSFRAALDGLMSRKDFLEKLAGFIYHDKKARGAGAVIMPVLEGSGNHSLREVNVEKEIMPFLKRKEMVLEKWRG